jgi:hypothetical protein
MDENEPIWQGNRRTIMKLLGTSTGGAIFSGMATSTAGASSSGHPYMLITDESEFSELQDRANDEPWSTWADVASQNWDMTLDAADSTNDWDNCRKLNSKASAASLMYILDSSNRSAYIDALLDCIDHFEQYFLDGIGGDWTSTVPQSSFVVTATLGLDIVYNDLTSTERDQAESVLGQAGDYFYNGDDVWWDLAKYGAYGTWAIYKKDISRAEEATSNVRSYHQNRFGDGVFAAGPEYAVG